MGDHLPPMLAFDNHGVFPQLNDDWWMEPKFDGVRWQVRRTLGGGVRSWIGRNGNEKTGVHPEIDEALSEIPFGTRLDGELYVVNDHHRLIVFDVLEYAGLDLIKQGIPLEDRAWLIKELWTTPSPFLEVMPHYEISEPFHRKLLEFGFEGSVVKRKSSLYRPGKRSRDWLKIKPQSTAEARVVGYKMGEGESNGHRIGALKIQLLDNDVYSTVGYDGDPRTFPELQGRVLEFAHHGLFESGSPRHPVFKRWRDDR